MITLSPEDYKKFVKLAKKQRILFSAIKNKGNTGQVVDVVLPAAELERANMVFQRMQNMPSVDSRENPLRRLENLFQRHEKTPEKDELNAHESSEIIVPEQEQSQEPERPPEMEKSPEPQPKEDVQKKDSQSRPDWQDIGNKLRSQSRNRADSTMRMNERPSIEKRLRDYRAKAEKQHLRSRDKSKIRNRTKSKTR